jgi:23S rRNA (adenine2503-C2)-methyltransferase
MEANPCASSDATHGAYNRGVIALETLQQALTALGAPRYRTAQVYQALTRDLVTSFDTITTLPLELRRELAAQLKPVLLDAVEERVSARGDTRKTLFRAPDGEPVEAVLMVYRERATVCVSTQVGCTVRCAFCASGAGGLRRDLSAEEMVDQVLHFARLLRDEDRRVTNVVFMGMGEPFLNYDATLRACRMLNDSAGFALVGRAARAISVSTAGVVPAIARFAAEPLQLNLAVSLHAATDELRDRLVPLNKRYPIAQLMAASAAYVAKTRRKLFFEWVVLPGVNDGDDQVAAIGKLLRKPLYHLNLIAYNATGGEFAAPTAAQLAAFRGKIERVRVAHTIRRSPGGEIDAACGQLALRLVPADGDRAASAAAIDQ